MKPRRLGWGLLLATGILASLAGVALVVAYIWGAIIDRIGEPDQSLLFWYLPFLMIGAAALVFGIAATVWGAIGLRRARRT